MKLSLKNKVCVVTGSSKGIGKAITVALAKHGCKLFLPGRCEGRLQKVADEASTYTENVNIFRMDLRDQDSIWTFTKDLQTQTDHIDILINCAGTFAFGMLNKFEEESFGALFETNVKGIFLLTQSMLPLLFAVENKPCEPEKLLQPEDIAETIIHSLQLPLTAEITDLYIRPFIKTY